MPQIYNDEFRQNIVRLHLQEGRTYKSLIDEFGVSKASNPVSRREILLQGTFY